MTNAGECSSSKTGSRCSPPAVVSPLIPALTISQPVRDASSTGQAGFVKVEEHGLQRAVVARGHKVVVAVGVAVAQHLGEVAQREDACPAR